MNPTGPYPDFSELVLDLEGRPINNIANNVNVTSEDDPSRGSHNAMDFLPSLEFNDQGQTGNNIVSNSTIDYSTYDSRVQDVNEMLGGDFTWGGECFYNQPPEFEMITHDPFAANIVPGNGNQPEEYHNYQTQLANFHETFDENLMWESLNLMELPPNFEIKEQNPTEYNIDTLNVKQPLENSTIDGHQLQEEMLVLSQNLTSTNDGQLQEEMPLLSQNLTSNNDAQLQEEMLVLSQNLTSNNDGQLQEEMPLLSQNLTSTNDGQLQEEMLVLSQNLTSNNDGQLQEEMPLLSQNLTSNNDAQLQEEMLVLSQNLTSNNDGQLQEEMQNLSSSYKIIDAEQSQNNNASNSPIQNTISEAQLQTVNDVTLTEENLINETPSYKINDQENVETENNIITKLPNDNTSSEYQIQNDGTFGEDLSCATQNLNELTSSNDPEQTENNGIIMFPIDNTSLTLSNDPEQTENNGIIMFPIDNTSLTLSNDPEQTENNGIIMFPIDNTSLTLSNDPEQMENNEVIMLPTDNTIDEAQVPEENVMNPSHILIDLTPSFVINDPRISTEIGTIFDLPIQYTSEQIMNMEVVLWEDMFPNVPSNFGQTD